MKVKDVAVVQGLLETRKALIAAIDFESRVITESIQFPNDDYCMRMEVGQYSQLLTTEQWNRVEGLVFPLLGERLVAIEEKLKSEYGIELE